MADNTVTQKLITTSDQMMQRMLSMAQMRDIQNYNNAVLRTGVVQVEAEADVATLQRKIQKKQLDRMSGALAQDTSDFQDIAQAVRSVDDPAVTKEVVEMARSLVIRTKAAIAARAKDRSEAELSEVDRLKAELKETQENLAEISKAGS